MRKRKIFLKLLTFCPKKVWFVSYFKIIFKYDFIILKGKRCQEILIFNFLLQPEVSLHLVGEHLEMYCTDSQTLVQMECGTNSSWNIAPNIAPCPLVHTSKCNVPTTAGLVVTPDKLDYSPGQYVRFSCDNENMALIGPSNTVCTLNDNGTAVFVSTPICQCKKCFSISLPIYYFREAMQCNFFRS